MKKLKLLLLTVLMAFCIYSVAGEYVVNLDALSYLIMTRENETSDKLGNEFVRDIKAVYVLAVEQLKPTASINLTDIQGTLTFGGSM